MKTRRLRSARVWAALAAGALIVGVLGATTAGAASTSRGQVSGGFVYEVWGGQVVRVALHAVEASDDAPAGGVILARQTATGGVGTSSPPPFGPPEPVVYVNVDGNAAAIAFYNAFDDNWAYSFLVDGGNPGTNGDTVGIARLSEAEAMTWVENMVVPANEWPLMGGNIVVQD